MGLYISGRVSWEQGNAWEQGNGLGKCFEGTRIYTGDYKTILVGEGRTPALAGFWEDF